MNEETQIITQEHPAANYRIATDVAGLCKEIVVKSAINIAGKKYVRVEGWNAIAIAHGCAASARDVERVEDGIRAIGEVRRMTDGIVIATAEGFVGDDEPMWQKRPEYAKRAMAQTRGISRACRSAFAHVVVMMDAGLSTTPAEEVPDGGFDNEKITQHEEKRERAARAAARVREHVGLTNNALAGVDLDSATNEGIYPEDVSPSGAQFKGDWRDVIVHWGASKGKRLGDLDEKGMRFFQAWNPKPFRGRISEQDATLRAALDAARDERKQKPHEGN